MIQHVTKDCAIVADHEDTRWLWIARMVCGAQWSPARKTRLSVELSTNIREVSQCPEKAPIIENRAFPSPCWKRLLAQLRHFAKQAPV